MFGIANSCSEILSSVGDIHCTVGRPILYAGHVALLSLPRFFAINRFILSYFVAVKMDDEVIVVNIQGTYRECAPTRVKTAVQRR